jgi:hypothetical protein
MLLAEKSGSGSGKYEPDPDPVKINRFRPHCLQENKKTTWKRTRNMYRFALIVNKKSGGKKY